MDYSSGKHDQRYSAPTAPLRETRVEKKLHLIVVIGLIILGLITLLMSLCGGYVTIIGIINSFATRAYAPNLSMLTISLPFLIVFGFGTFFCWRSVIRHFRKPKD